MRQRRPRPVAGRRQTAGSHAAAAADPSSHLWKPLAENVLGLGSVTVDWLHRAWLLGPPEQGPAVPLANGSAGRRCPLAPGVVAFSSACTDSDGYHPLMLERKWRHGLAYLVAVTSSPHRCRLRPPLDIGAGFGVGGHPAQHDGPQGAVGLPVAATVEAVVAVGLARLRPQSPLVPVYRKHLIGRWITVAQQTVPRSAAARSQPAGANAGSRPSNASCAGAASCPSTTTPPGRGPGSATSAAPGATPCTRSSTPATSGSPPQPFPGSYRSSPTTPSSSTARPTAAHRTATNLTPRRPSEEIRRQHPPNAQPRSGTRFRG